MYELANIDAAIKLIQQLVEMVPEVVISGAKAGIHPSITRYPDNDCWGWETTSESNHCFSVVLCGVKPHFFTSTIQSCFPGIPGQRLEDDYILWVSLTAPEAFWWGDLVRTAVDGGANVLDWR